MAGIYLHIPFCKTKCHYCDFYSGTDFSLFKEYEKTLIFELKKRIAYLNGEPIQTIYFGGGTPSLLSLDFYRRIFEAIFTLYSVDPFPEITFEANPDDLASDYVKELSALPVNRISIGIQSFLDQELKLLNRRHSAFDAEQAVKYCQDTGFEHISIDLMYGLPGQSLNNWMHSLEKAIRLDVEHISAYHLIYEEGTPLFHSIKTENAVPVDEDMSNAMFEMLMNKLTSVGYNHYEISNFAKIGCESKHNTSYWKGINYLGIGPSAHSYDGISRSYNVADIRQYIAAVERNEAFQTTEFLDQNTLYNEYIITSLRTSDGIFLPVIEEKYGKSYLTYLLKQAKKYIDSGLLIRTDDRYLKLSRKGVFISDGIMSDLLIVQ